MQERRVDSQPVDSEAAAPSSYVSPSPSPAGPESSIQPAEPELRAVALAAEESGAPGCPVGIWKALLRGELAVLSTVYTDERWLLVLGEAELNALPRPHVGPATPLLESLLLGHSQKRTALERGVCPSTLSTRAHRALELIGVALTPRRAPAMLSLLAGASAGLAVPPVRLGRFPHGSRRCLVVGAGRPELHLRHKLPPAEYGVLCRIVEGASYAEIAAQRGTSRRTIANQLASIFHRLGVSGRGELIRFLITGSPFPSQLPNAS
jgi:DNA-binding CsgD family transcriptional regulator